MSRNLPAPFRSDLRGPRPHRGSGGLDVCTILSARASEMSAARAQLGRRRLLRGPTQQRQELRARLRRQPPRPQKRDFVGIGKEPAARAHASLLPVCVSVIE